MHTNFLVWTLVFWTQRYLELPNFAYVLSIISRMPYLLVVVFDPISGFPRFATDSPLPYGHARVDFHPENTILQFNFNNFAHWSLSSSSLFREGVV